MNIKLLASIILIFNAYILYAMQVDDKLQPDYIRIHSAKSEHLFDPVKSVEIYQKEISPSDSTKCTSEKLRKKQLYNFIGYATDISTYDNSGNITTSLNFIFDRNNNIIEINIKKSKLTSKMTFITDTIKRQIIAKNNYSSGTWAEEVITSSFYDSLNNVFKEIEERYDINSQPKNNKPRNSHQTTYSYIYDANKRVTNSVQTIIFPNMTKIVNTDFKYDSHGNMLEQISTSNGQVNMQTNVSYRENDTPIQVKRTFKMSVISTHTEEYNENYALTLTERFENNVLKSRTRYEYLKYDNHKNWTERKVYNYDDKLKKDYLAYIETRKIEYYSKQ